MKKQTRRTIADYISNFARAHNGEKNEPKKKSGKKPLKWHVPAQQTLNALVVDLDGQFEGIVGPKNFKPFSYDNKEKCYKLVGGLIKFYEHHSHKRGQEYVIEFTA